MDFAGPADHKVELKESEKKIHTWILPDLKLMVTVISVVIRALGSITKNPEKRLEKLELRRRIGTI